MKKKHEMFSSPTAKRAEIEEVLAIAQKLTNAGYGDIWFTLANEEMRYLENKKGGYYGGKHDRQ